MTSQKLLLKIQKILVAAIDSLNVDYSTSILQCRRILELVIHKFYELNNIKKPKTAYGYPTLFLLVKKIVDDKLAEDKVLVALEFVKDNGNKIAHKYDIESTKDLAQKVIQSISLIVLWLLENQKINENSLGLLSIRRAKVIKDRLIKGGYHHLLNYNIKELLKVDLFLEPEKAIEITRQIKQYIVIDKEIKEYSRIIILLVKEYQELRNKKNILLGGIVLVASKLFEKPIDLVTELVFKKRYKLKLKKIDELRTLISTRYAIK